MIAIAHVPWLRIDFREILTDDGRQLVDQARLEELIVENGVQDYWQEAVRMTADHYGMCPETDDELAAARRYRNRLFLGLLADAC